LQGCTAVQLHVIDEEMLGEAITLAWRNTSEKGASGSKTRTSRRRTK